MTLTFNISFSGKRSPVPQAMLLLPRTGVGHATVSGPARILRADDCLVRWRRRSAMFVVDSLEGGLCRRADARVISSSIGVDWFQLGWTRQWREFPGSAITGKNRQCKESSRSFVCTVVGGDSRAGPNVNVVEKKERSVSASWIRPLFLKRDSKIPKQWDGPNGTAVLIDKPIGWTSFAVCAKLRSLTKVKKVGHAGTLDPLATGLLVLCLGKATKVVDRYQAMTKVYSGTIRLGELTPSGDADTEVTERLPWEHVQDADIETAKKAFVGDIMQVPPIYSALKMKGERLYEKARRGEEVEMPPRPVTIFELKVERNSQSRQDLNFRVVCSKGTYVRSLCRDLGLALKSCAHLTALRREKIGELSVEDAWTVADLQAEYARLYM